MFFWKSCFFDDLADVCNLISGPSAFSKSSLNIWKVTVHVLYQVVLVVKNPPPNVRHPRDTGSTPGSGRSPGGGHGNPLQYSCWENPMDRGAWWAAVHGVSQSRTRLKATWCRYTEEDQCVWRGEEVRNEAKSCGVFQVEEWPCNSINKFINQTVTL